MKRTREVNCVNELKDLEKKKEKDRRRKGRRRRNILEMRWVPRETICSEINSVHSIYFSVYPIYISTNTV